MKLALSISLKNTCQAERAPLEGLTPRWLSGCKFIPQSGNSVTLNGLLS